MKMIHSCFLNSMLGSLQLHFCIFQMGFCWTVCVAFSFLFNTFLKQQKERKRHENPTKQESHASLCTSFFYTFFFFQNQPFLKYIKKYDRVTILLRSKSLKKSKKT